MPIISPPTPAPSPTPAHASLVPASSLNDPIYLARSQFASLDSISRRMFLSAVVDECSQEELLFVSTKVAPLLRRDFLRDLPLELALHIISFLDDPQSLARTSRVSRYWNRLLADDWIWRRLCRVHGFTDGLENPIKEDPITQESRFNEDQRLMEEDMRDDDDVANMLIPISPSPSQSSPSTSAGPYKRHSMPSYPSHPPTREPLTGPTRLPPGISAYEHFKYEYATTKNWLRGGKLLRIHRVPLLSHQPPIQPGPTPVALPLPSTATPTSVALDESWLVVGLANSRVLVFSARTGVLSRTLVGHQSGVWAVALIRGGGSGEGAGAAAHESEEVDIAMDVDSPEIVPDPGPEGRKQQPDASRDPGADAPEDVAPEHLVPPTLRQALGLERSPGKSRWGRPKSASQQLAQEKTKRRDPLPRLYPEKPSDPAGASDGWGQPNSLVVSGGCDKVLRVWDVKSGYCIYELRGHTSTIRCLKVLHGRPIAVSGSRDRSVRVWDVQRGRALRVLTGHEQSVRCLDVFGNRVVSGSYDCTCRVWDVDTGECLHVLSGHFNQIYSVAFDGVRIASGGLDTTVRVWDANTGECLALLQGHTALVCQLQLLPTMLATGGSDGRVITFSLRSASFGILQRLAAHDSSVTGLQLDERLLVTCGNDGRVRLFQFDRETELCEYVRELSDPSESVWKVAYTRETLVVICKRGGKTVMEIWSYKPDLS
ncbi:hypothetical protein CERSUDRAFT_113078, partial [Gelatoporia subvermispora B]